MRKLNIGINSRNYTVECDADQADHIRQLSDEIDSRAKMIAASMPQTNEATVLMMTCLHLADELYETRQETGKLHEQILFEKHDLHDVLPDHVPMKANQRLTDMMHNVSSALDDLSMRIEKFA